MSASAYAQQAMPIDNPTPAPAAASAAPAKGTITRAMFTNTVVDREPKDTLTNLTNDATQVYFFTELHDLAGQTVTHQWEYNGKVMFEKKFDVGAARWRVFSAKTLDPSWLGEWKVSVLDAQGGTLGVNTFTYTKATAAAPAAATPVSATAVTPTTTK